MRRPALVLLILLGLLAGLYFWLQQPGNPLSAALAGTATPSLSAPEFLVGPQKPSFSKIELTDPKTGRSLLLQSSGGTWTLKENGGSLAAVSQPEAENSAGALRDTQILRHLQGNPADFGLEKPSLLLSIEYIDGNRLQVKIGDQAITKSGYYALLENGEIVLLNAAGVEELQRLLSAPPYLFTPTPAG